MHKMIRITILASVLPIVFLSCNTDQTDQKDCICTKEFRTYGITITNSDHQPVDSLIIRVYNKNLHTLYRTDSSSILDPYHIPGRYIVLTDAESKYFTVVPETVVFLASKPNLDIVELFMFSVDPCRCHLQKISGRDSVIVP
jgi:hypothetical protein